MLSTRRYIYVALCFIFLLFLKSFKNNLNVPIKPSNSYPKIIYGNFSCETWKNNSYIDVKKYLDCLQWGVNGGFWAVESIRHTAQKNLLDSNSIIVEVGGNRGHDTVKFIEFYNSTILSFEPLFDNWKNLIEQFKTNKKIEIYQYGFGSYERDVLVEMNDVGNAGTSIFRKFSSENSTLIRKIHLLNIVETMRNIIENRTSNKIIDMISINCEGCEFEVIPALILNNMTYFFRIIQFATHTGFLPESSSCIYCQIQQGLERTHQRLYHYSKLWEGWVMKNKTI